MSKKTKTGRHAIHRATAARLLEQLMERVTYVNGPDSPYAMRVKQVFVFGSYLKGKDRSNDLDVIVELESRFSDRKEQGKAESERIELRESRFANITEEVLWPTIEVLRFLKGRSGRVSLHETDHVEWLRQQGQPVQLIYTRE